jgi:hypothetical protein
MPAEAGIQIFLNQNPASIGVESKLSHETQAEGGRKWIPF